MNEELPIVVSDSQLLVFDQDWNKSLKIADLCKQIIETCAVRIGQNLYITVEGWQAISAAWGCTPATEEPLRTEDGYRCKAILRRDSDGAILSTAYGFVGDDEPVWSQRTRHANEGMAQTRAMSRVCANKFRFLAVLMRIEGLKTTPAEEMPSTEEAPPRRTNGGSRISKQTTPQQANWRLSQQQQAAQPAPVSMEPPPPPAPKQASNGVPQPGDTAPLIGIITNCRRSEFEGKVFYWADLQGRVLFSANAELGEDLMKAQGQEIEAMLRKGTKPNRYTILDFHYLEKE